MRRGGTPPKIRLAQGICRGTAGLLSAAVVGSTVLISPSAGADPSYAPDPPNLIGQINSGNPSNRPSPPDTISDRDMFQPMPPVVPTASDWRPKFPFPYDQTRNRVTAADITAMREMCQWFNAQYPTLRSQIDRLEFNRDGPDGKDYDRGRDGIQQQADIVSGNIAESVDFLAPRAQALTQDQNSFGDNYFPIYEGEAFFKLWEQLSNVNNGIRANQAAWFIGPSVQKAKRWGSDIQRSHVCE